MPAVCLDSGRFKSTVMKWRQRRFQTVTVGHVVVQVVQMAFHSIYGTTFEQFDSLGNTDDA